MAETLWDNGPRLLQEKGVFPMGTDSVLLADFAAASPRANILDLGCGTGILTILKLFGHPGRTATALELSEDACRLARNNFDLNGLSSVKLVQGDLRDHRTLIPTGQFDLTISNPPYFSAGSGPAASGGLSAARGETACTLEELCQAAGWSTRWGGSFCLVYRPERIVPLFLALRASGFEPKRIRPVNHDPSAPVNLILVEARRGGNPGLVWERDLYLRTPEGEESPELQAIYRRRNKE